MEVVIGAVLVLLFVLFLAARLWAKPEKDCPECAESVLREATVCRYCGHRFS